METTFKRSSIKVAPSHFSARRGAEGKPASQRRVKGDKCGNCNLHAVAGSRDIGSPGPTVTTGGLLESRVRSENLYSSGKVVG